MDPLREVARRHGPRRAMLDRSAGFWVSWFDLDGLAHDWARRFRDLGLRPGQRVAAIEPAGVRLAALLHAGLRSGAALVPISPRAPAVEVDRVLADCRPRLLVRDGELEDLPDADTGDPADACVLYTSGTTGRPKGVRLTLDNHLASAAGCARALEATDADRWLLCLAPHHVGGLAILLRSAVCNQPVITLDRFEVAAVLEAIRSDRPSLVSLVPTMLTRLLEAGGLDDLRTLRAILVGGAPAGADQVREWARLGLQVCPSYGLTETCSQIAVVPPGRALELAGSSGLVGAQAAVEVEQDGEIVVSGPAVSPGYVNSRLPDGPLDGRFRTGDLGRLDGDLLTVLGRKDETVITGGENVHPAEVEAVLRSHPGVRDAAVAGRPDATWGQVLAAWVTAEGVEAAELETWCRERLAPAKIPRRWTFVAGLPRTEGGKLRRRDLP
ncbi:MAG: AMP-binding protein [Actinobacteria bacterium]|nr:AMP-binding protein [Actinomycetota bacterium]